MHDQFAQIRELFLDAMECDGLDAQLAFARERCANRLELRAKLEKMLRAHHHSDDFLASQVDKTEPSGAAAGLGNIGPYKLREKIGEGGFAVVYVAEQTEPVNRKVALKVIKPGMDTKDVIARFEAERQALAMMDHPNVARVLDAGTTDSGHPYFVMELVHGLSITDFCDHEKFANRDRLQLFVKVCRAVQHAHQKGIIHRDLKPSNIMVTMHDDQPVPKVIDFGISKALSQKLTEKTIYTAYGQIVGTPLYMSPEQVQLSDLDVDTRSDVYSLGVLLYQLLTGTTPFDREQLKRAGLDELRRIIREDNPPRPSNRVSTLNADSLATVCDQRQVDQRELRQSIRGDLDWIVMKALEKDRTRRYESATAFAADIVRYLSDEPVEARPPSSMYLLRKFTRRHKAALATMALTVASLLVGLAFSVWQWLEASKARQLAEDNLLVARQAVDDMYTQFGEKWLSSQPGMTSLQREFLEKALSYYEQFALQDADNPQVRQKAGEACIRVANILNALERFTESEKACRQAILIFGDLVAQHSDVPAYRHHLGRIFQSLAFALGDTGRDREAHAAQLRAVAIYQALVDEFPQEPRFRQGLGHTTNSLGHAWLRLDRPTEAKTAFRRALAIHERTLTNSPKSLECMTGLGNSLQSLGSLLSREDPHDEAESLLRRALNLYEQIAENNPAAPRYKHSLATSHALLRDLLWQTGRHAEAAELSQKARHIWQKLVDDFPKVFDYHACLAGEYQRQSQMLGDKGQFKESEQLLRQSLALRQQWVAAAPERPTTKRLLGEGYHQLGRLLYMAGRHKEAGEAHRKGFVLHEKLVAEFPSSLNCRRAMAESRWRLARFLTFCPDPQLHDSKRATKLITNAIKQRPKHSGYWTTLGVARYRTANWQGAVMAFEKSMDLAPSQKDAMFRFFVAMTHWQLGQIREARAWYDQAVERMGTVEPVREELRRVRSEAEQLMGISTDPMGERTKLNDHMTSNSRAESRMTTTGAADGLQAVTARRLTTVKSGKQTAGVATPLLHGPGDQLLCPHPVDVSAQCVTQN